MRARTDDRRRGASQPASAGHGGFSNILAILGAALALRLAYLWEASQSPFAASLYLPIDAYRYHIRAVEWLHGAWPGHDAFFRPPLYPFFLGSIYALTGPNPVAALAVQAVLGALSVVLLAWIGGLLFRPVTGAVAGITAAFYAPFPFYEAQVMKTGLGVFLLLAGTLLVVRGRGSWSGFFAGILLGMTLLIRENALLFLAAAVIWAAWGWARGQGSRRRALLLLLGGQGWLLGEPLGLEGLGRDVADLVRLEQFLVRALVL